jgi:hypothetical protein
VDLSITQYAQLLVPSLSSFSTAALEVTVRTASWMLRHRGQRGFIHEGPVRKSIGVTLVVGRDDGISHVDHFGLL